MEKFDVELSRFQKAIFADATVKRDALLEETEQRRKKALEEKNDELLLKAYQQLQASTAKLEREASTAVSKAEMEAKRSLLVRREELSQEIFENVTKRLRDFTQSEEYSEFLKQKLDALREEKKLSGSVVICRKEDLPLMERLTGDSQIAALQGDEEILIGGFRCQNLSEGFLADETLDMALEDQKEWFFTNSGLAVD